MTQEDKELLFIDLSARLPFGVIVRHADYLVDSDGNYTGKFWYKRGYLYDICRMDDMTTTIIESEDSDEEGYEHICDLERSLPYLRPISSMTEEEYKELKLISPYYGFAPYEYIYDWCPNYEMIDFCNKNHFDYRGLIEKGLAIEVTENNNSYKE